jgi:hypothetical protein
MPFFKGWKIRGGGWLFEMGAFILGKNLLFMLPDIFVVFKSSKLVEIKGLKVLNSNYIIAATARLVKWLQANIMLCYF